MKNSSSLSEIQETDNNCMKYCDFIFLALAYDGSPFLSLDVGVSLGTSEAQEDILLPNSRLTVQHTNY